MGDQFDNEFDIIDVDGAFETIDIREEGTFDKIRDVNKNDEKADEIKDTMESVLDMDSKHRVNHFMCNFFAEEDEEDRPVLFQRAMNSYGTFRNYMEEREFENIFNVQYDQLFNGNMQPSDPTTLNIIKRSEAFYNARKSPNKPRSRSRRTLPKQKKRSACERWCCCFSY